MSKSWCFSEACCRARNFLEHESVTSTNRVRLLGRGGGGGGEDLCDAKKGMGVF